MGAARGTRVVSYALVIIALLAFTLNLGEAFVRPIRVSQTRHGPLPGGNSRSPLGAQRTAENDASPPLTKHLAPPVVSVRDDTLTFKSSYL